MIMWLFHQKKSSGSHSAIYFTCHRENCLNRLHLNNITERQYHNQLKHLQVKDFYFKILSMSNLI